MKTTTASRRHFLGTSMLGVSALMLPRFALAADDPAKHATKLTMLNGTAGSDFETAARRHAELGLKWLDLKDSLWGENINNLSLDNARRAADIAKAHGLKVFCFSTALCESELNAGEDAFRARHFKTLDHVLKLADIIEPAYVRLISAKLKPYDGPESRMEIVERDFPWTFGVYREMVDRMVGAGRRVLVENEIGNVIFNRPEGILRFFERLERPGKVHYTWDIQNLWQEGVFPTMEVYQQLKPVIGCLHVKGGRTEGESKLLVNASTLEEASWPVREIVSTAVADGVAPYICVNPCHGKKPPGYDTWEVAKSDIAYLRKIVPTDT
jgi:hypothetical protein